MLSKTLVSKYRIFRQNDHWLAMSWSSSILFGDSLGITGGSFVKPQPSKGPSIYYVSTSAKDWVGGGWV